MTAQRTIKKNCYLFTASFLIPRAALHLTGISCTPAELLAFTLVATWVSIALPKRLTPQHWEFKWLAHPDKTRRFFAQTLLLTAKHTALSMPIVWYGFTSEAEKQSLLSKGSPTLLILTYLVLAWYFCLFINILVLYRKQRHRTPSSKQ